MKRMLMAAAVMTATALPVFAQAELQDYAEVGTWYIAIDPGMGDGCVMISEFEDNSVVRIGFDMTTDTAYVLSANPSWGDIEQGKAYPVTIALDGNSFSGEATGSEIDGLPAADIVFDNPDFFGNLVQAQTLSLSHGENEVMSIDLTGAGDAVVKMIECQDAQIAKKG